MRLVGSRLRDMLVKSEDEAAVTETFQQASLGERKADFQRVLITRSSIGVGV